MCIHQDYSFSTMHMMSFNLSKLPGENGIVMRNQLWWGHSLASWSSIIYIIHALSLLERCLTQLICLQSSLNKILQYDFVYNNFMLIPIFVHLLYIIRVTFRNCHLKIFKSIGRIRELCFLIRVLPSIKS